MASSYRWQGSHSKQHSRDPELDNNASDTEGLAQPNGADHSATNEDEFSDEEPVTKKHAAHDIKGININAKPTQMWYYSGAWVDILKAAKNCYRLYLHTATADAFPECNMDSLQDANDCLLEVIAQHKDNHNAILLDEGMSHLSLI
jgi:hypothetical protein